MSIRITVNSLESLPSLVALALSLQNRMMDLQTDPRFESRVELRSLREEVLEDFDEAIRNLDQERIERDRRDRAPTPVPTEVCDSEGEWREPSEADAENPREGQTQLGRSQRQRTSTEMGGGRHHFTPAPSILF